MLSYPWKTLSGSALKYRTGGTPPRSVKKVAYSLQAFPSLALAANNGLRWYQKLLLPLEWLKRGLWTRHWWQQKGERTQAPLARWHVGGSSTVLRQCRQCCGCQSRSCGVSSGIREQCTAGQNLGWAKLSRSNCNSIAASIWRNFGVDRKTRTGICRWTVALGCRAHMQLGWKMRGDCVATMRSYRNTMKALSMSWWFDWCSANLLTIDALDNLYASLETASKGRCAFTTSTDEFLPRIQCGLL